MSFTKPIISVDATLRAGLTGVVALIAAFTAYEASRGLLGERARVDATGALAAAERLAPGAARDRQLGAAQAIAQRGVRLAPENEDLWNLLGEAQLVQATGAAGPQMSSRLLAAAAEASARAAALEPCDPAPSARIALARALQEDGKAAVGAALAQSYAASAFDPALGQRRLEAAGRAWPALSADVRASALLEACQLSRRGDAERKALYNLRMGPADSGMALALDKIMADPSCAVRS